MGYEKIGLYKAIPGLKPGVFEGLILSGAFPTI